MIAPNQWIKLDAKPTLCGFFGISWSPLAEWLGPLS